MPTEGQDNFKPLQVSKKKHQGGTYCYIGFPIKSLQKFVPDYKFNPVDDEYITLTINLPLEDVQFEDVQKEFTTWKDELKLTEKYKKQEQPDIVIQPRSISFIMSQVLSYPLEKKTPIENIEFISMLKQQLSALF